MWELDCEDSWVPKNWCFWTVVLKILGSALDYKEIQLVHSEGDQSWVFFGRTDAKAETAILWPPHGKSWLIGKDSHAGRDWGQQEKGTTEDEMAGWHHRLDAHEFEWTPGVGDGQRGLACCDSWGRKVLDTTEQQKWTELILSHLLEYRFSIFLSVLYSFFMGMKADTHLFLCGWSSSQNSRMLATKCIEDHLVQFHQLKILKSRLINNLNR